MKSRTTSELTFEGTTCRLTRLAAATRTDVDIVGEAAHLAPQSLRRYAFPLSLDEGVSWLTHIIWRPATEMTDILPGVADLFFPFFFFLLTILLVLAHGHFRLSLCIPLYFHFPFFSVPSF